MNNDELDEIIKEKITIDPSSYKVTLNGQNFSINGFDLSSGSDTSISIPVSYNEQWRDHAESFEERFNKLEQSNFELLKKVDHLEKEIARLKDLNILFD